MVIAAIAEPIEEKREYVRKRYNVPAQMCFETGEEMFAQERLADVALICTQDAMHVGHAVAALEKGDAMLADSLALFEEGTKLIASCSKQLDQAEQQVVKLMKGEDGAPVELPFGEEA